MIIINRGAYLTLLSGNEDLPTNEELDNIPILQYKDVDPDGRNGTLMSDILPKQAYWAALRWWGICWQRSVSHPPTCGKRIANCEFVVMEELLPELWPAAHPDREGKAKKNRKILNGSSASHCTPAFAGNTTWSR